MGLSLPNFEICVFFRIFENRSNLATLELPTHFFLLKFVKSGTMFSFEILDNA